MGMFLHNCPASNWQDSLVIIENLFVLTGISFSCFCLFSRRKQSAFPNSYRRDAVIAMEFNGIKGPARNNFGLSDGAIAL
jgi:hypothetical protein